MAIDRYTRTDVIAFGEYYGTAVGHSIIRSAIKAGVLPYAETVLRGRERLDTLAGSAYGEGRYWWIIAAASDIGWGLQVPPGTVIRIPDLLTVLKLVG